jgi:hypothetical protein
MGSVKLKTTGGKQVVLKTSKAPKGAPRSKRPGANNGPARQRYWAENRLRKHKVRNLMRYNGMTRSEAELLWDSSRVTRKKR